MPSRHEQDEAGQWWYVWGKSGRQLRVRVEARSCDGCGESYLPKGNRGGRFCSRQCSMRHTGKSYDKEGEGHPGWKGGRSLNAQGYVRVWLPPEEREAHGGRKYVLEHRLVMAEKLGRLLYSHEQVHHINGVRDDNRPENLELWNRSHPNGARAVDLRHCPTCTCGH